MLLLIHRPRPWAWLTASAYEYEDACHLVFVDLTATLGRALITPVPAMRSEYLSRTPYRSRLTRYGTGMGTPATFISHQGRNTTGKYGEGRVHVSLAKISAQGLLGSFLVVLRKRPEVSATTRASCRSRQGTWRSVPYLPPLPVLRTGLKISAKVPLVVTWRLNLNASTPHPRSLAFGHFRASSTSSRVRPTIVSHELSGPDLVRANSQ